jgi:streptomycin 6-kinase
MTRTTLASAETRLAHVANAWSVRIERTTATQSSLIAYGTAAGEAVVLKIVKSQGDEWRAGDILSAFHGSGAVRVLACDEGAVLLERALPGESLFELSRAGRDDEAIGIIADTIAKMSSRVTPVAAPSVHDWGRSFATYLTSADARIPREDVVHAGKVFAHLASSQTKTRLLHGDLQHYNVVRDARRGWLAIDPKGVIGEVEYEIGAALRNPVDLPSVFLDRGAIERRVAHFAHALTLDRDRILAWAYAQAVLSAIWNVEDGFDVDPDSSVLKLAALLEPMIV